MSTYDRAMLGVRREDGSGEPGQLRGMGEGREGGQGKKKGRQRRRRWEVLKWTRGGVTSGVYLPLQEQNVIVQGGGISSRPILEDEMVVISAFPMPGTGGHLA